MSSPAHAQGCPDPWGSASNVFATFYLEGSGSASSFPYTQDVSQSVTMMAVMPQQQPQTCVFVASTPGGIGVVVDPTTLHDQFTDSLICGGEPPIQYYYWDATGSGVTTTIVLGITPTLNVYGFGASDTIPGIFKEVGCVNGSINQNISWGPLSGINEQFLPLPAEAELSGTKSFTGSPADTTSNLPANWNMAWSFSPVPDDDCEPCKKGDAPAVGSDLSLRSQSLGEDIPLIGTPFSLHYESARARGRAGADAVAINYARGLGGWTLSGHHALEPLLQSYCMGGSCTPYAKVPKALYLGNGDTRTDDTVQAGLPLNGNLYVTSEDGSEIYVFGSNYLHTQTLRPMTGAVLYKFGYDTFNRLTTITDANGNITTIQRDANENPTAILAPFGQKTTLTVDSNGFLSQVTDPMGLATKLTYTPSGLLATLTDHVGNIYHYDYDIYGRLTKHSDPAGGSVSLTRTDNSSAFTVTETTALGRSASYQIGFSSNSSQTGRQFTNTWENGLQATESRTMQAGQVSESKSLPDGVTYSVTMGPDPRWGIQAPVITSKTVTAGDLTMNVTGSRTATLNNSNDPFSLNTQTDTETVNGRAYTTLFTASNSTFTQTSPVGRKVTATLDSKERLSSFQINNLTATKIAYNSRGLVTTLKQGTRKTSFGYDAKGRLATYIDPLGLKTSLTRDADGRLLTIKLPDTRTITYTYDVNGNIASVTPPGKPPHSYAYTTVNLPSSYTPPAISGTGATTFAYNVDRDLTTITRPDGGIITENYDSAGRLSSLVTPASTTSYAYDTTTGNLTSAAISGGEQISFAYDGPLPQSATWAGDVVGSVSRSRNNNFWVTAQSINGGNTINFSYDNDGLLTQAGSQALSRSPQTGLITASALGKTRDSRSYNSFGELTSYQAKYKTTSLYSVQFTRDAGGRISGTNETIGGSSNTWGYTYDTAGRLTEVKQNGASLVTYTYDTNSNRLTAVTSSGTADGTYDDQDRLLTYGNASYAYTANGELASKTQGTDITNYQYDALGNLIGATLADGTVLGYVVDSENGRVGKKVNGVLVAGFLYNGRDIVAQLNGSNQLVSQFIYASGSTAPAYMVKGGVTYRIFSDQLGSPRLVVNASSGQVVEQIDYDTFGNVINDTNPGFQPFGFAGGLYDQDTKLVRFGARDYDPSTGRWTAKDPTLFASSDPNLYGYVLNDPVNHVDPTGLDCAACKLKDHVKDKALDDAKDNIAPGAQKEVKQIVEEDQKSIPIIGDFFEAIANLFGGANQNLCGGGNNPQKPNPDTPKNPPLKQFQNR